MWLEELLGGVRSNCKGQGIAHFEHSFVATKFIFAILLAKFCYNYNIYLVLSCYPINLVVVHLEFRERIPI